MTWFVPELSALGIRQAAEGQEARRCEKHYEVIGREERGVQGGRLGPRDDCNFGSDQVMYYLVYTKVAAGMAYNFQRPRSLKVVGRNFGLNHVIYDLVWTRVVGIGGQASRGRPRSDKQ